MVLFVQLAYLLAYAVLLRFNDEQRIQACSLVNGVLELVLFLATVAVLAVFKPDGQVVEQLYVYHWVRINSIIILLQSIYLRLQITKGR